MIKLNGKYTYEMAFDISNMMGSKYLTVGIYKNEPSVLQGLFEDFVSSIEQTYDEYCNLYVRRELSDTESKIIDSLNYIKATFPEPVYRGLRISLESDIDEETRKNTIFYSQYKDGDKTYVMYHVPKEKVLGKEPK